MACDRPPSHFHLERNNESIMLDPSIPFRVPMLGSEISIRNAAPSYALHKSWSRVTLRTRDNSGNRCLVDVDLTSLVRSRVDKPQLGRYYSYRDNDGHPYLIIPVKTLSSHANRDKIFMFITRYVEPFDKKYLRINSQFVASKDSERGTLLAPSLNALMYHRSRTPPLHFYPLAASSRTPWVSATCLRLRVDAIACSSK
jgi:hypothetical protein